MKRKFHPTEIINDRRILKFVATLGDKDFYKVECQKCGTQYTIKGESLIRHHACRHCNGLRAPAAIPLRMRAPKDD